MIKKLSGYMRILGVIFIIGFSVMSIFFSFIIRGLPDNSEYTNLMSYSSFFENKFYDFRYNQILAPEAKNEEIVLINLDDESLQTLGTWPVDRRTWAKMLDNLKSYGAKVVAFDVIFPEEVKTCGVNADSPDDIFAAAIENFQEKEGNKVIMAYTTQEDQTYVDEKGKEIKNDDLFAELPEDLFSFMIDSQQADENVNFS